jgi:hypothetical protein
MDLSLYYFSMTIPIGKNTEITKFIYPQPGPYTRYTDKI